MNAGVHGCIGSYSLYPAYVRMRQYSLRRLYQYECADVEAKLKKLCINSVLLLHSLGRIRMAARHTLAISLLKFAGCPLLSDNRGRTS